MGIGGKGKDEDQMSFMCVVCMCASLYACVRACVCVSVRAWVCVCNRVCVCRLIPRASGTFGALCAFIHHALTFPLSLSPSPPLSFPPSGI